MHRTIFSLVMNNYMIKGSIVKGKPAIGCICIIFHRGILRRIMLHFLVTRASRRRFKFYLVTFTVVVIVMVRQKMNEKMYRTKWRGVNCLRGVGWEGKYWGEIGGRWGPRRQLPTRTRWRWPWWLHLPDPYGCKIGVMTNDWVIVHCQTILIEVSYIHTN